MTRRLKLGPWLLIWGALVAAQGYAFVATIDTSAALAAALVLGLQLVKMPFTAWRLNDLGRSADDAVLGLVPLANLGLAFQLLSGTPSDKVRDQRVAQWEGELTATQAFAQGAKLLVRGLPYFVPFIVPAAVAYAGLYAFGAWFLDWMLSAPEASVESARQGLFGAAGVLVLYAMFQLAKRGSASRGSWIPALLAIPCAMLGLALQLRGSRDLGPFVISAPYEALDLLWQCFAGALLAVVWLTIGDALLRGEKPSFDEVGRNLRERGADMIAVHGGASTAVFVGLQVVIPGIHYLLVYAFTDHSVLFEPKRPAFARSSRLTNGIRRRIFKAMYLGFLVYIIPALSLGLLLAGPDAFVASLFDPREQPWYAHAGGQVGWLLMVALTKLTLLVMWRERAAKDAVAEPARVGPVAAMPIGENVYRPAEAP